MVIHIVALLLLTMIFLPSDGLDGETPLIGTTDWLDKLEELEELDVRDEPIQPVNIEVADLLSSGPEAETEDVEIYRFEEPAAALSVELGVGLARVPRNNLMAATGVSTTESLLDGRGEVKGRLVAEYGGSPGSERAVAWALEWLANHQMPDGSWDFNHAACRKCRNRCGNPGSLPQSQNAATGLALLPFLGAGQTHQSGQYKKEIAAGLGYLVERMKSDGSLLEGGGRMYGHGIAAIAICEAYAMTRDKKLRDPAQRSIEFICRAQDQVGGGWRYFPKQPGDTSVLGWQIMALKSGHLAYLRVPPTTVKKAYGFLDTVAIDGGSQYGYTDPEYGREATTAIGLLCRMYLGWKRDEPALERGIQWLSEQGPSQTDMYYNYYATQVMRHREGEPWEKWNAVMRDQLVDSQAVEGHEKGSWFFPARHGQVGGRLYCTSMAAMILEVYYRHLPLYRKQSTENDFRLD
jgi:hypothetical protein